MSISRPHLATAAIAVLASVFGVGCTADRSADAGRIRDQLGSMPGVGAVDVGYVNDFENGPNLEISLDMLGATDADISAVSHRISELTSSFDDHRRRTDFIVAPSSVLRFHAEIGQVDVAAEAHVLRGIRPQLSASWVQWEHYDGRSRVELWSAATPDDDLRAALDTSLAGATEVYVRSAVPAEHGSWEVELPLSDTELSEVVRQRNELPVRVVLTDVRDSRVVALTVDLGAPAVAYANVLGMLAELTPSPRDPVDVEWSLSGATPREAARFTACSWPVNPGPPAPAPDFTALDDHLTALFAGCAG